MGLTLYIFDEKYVVRDVTDSISELTHTEQAYTCFARFRARVEVAEGWGFGFMCIDGRFRIFEIDDISTDEESGLTSVNGTDAAVRELLDEPLTDRRPTNATASGAVSSLISDTRFTLGRVTASGAAASMRAYYENVWSALETARTTYACEIVPYFEFADGKISARRVDVLARLGENRGRVFEVGDDAQGVTVDVDYSAVKTALYGRGRGVEIDNGEGNEASFGRRLTFAEAVWSKANGDPADKPAGQEWVGDPDALASFGRDGRHRFGFAVFEDCTDAQELLRLTWEKVQEQKAPLVTVSATVADTEKVWGREHEAVRLGDDVGLNIPRRKLFVSARIVGVERDYLNPEKTKLTIGNAKITSGDLMKSMKRQVDSYAARADVWDRANAFDLNGVMDVMNNQIKSTKGRWFTDPDTGGLMFVSEDETLAMRLTGAGWQIADGKVGGAWNWRTAATGKGLVVDETTTGTLNANVVKFSGTGTYLDGTTLRIQHPSLNAQTEIGLDGFLMMQNGKVVGGLFKHKNEVVSAVSTLFNPDADYFRAAVGRTTGIGLIGFGIDLIYNGVVGGNVGIYTSEEYENAPPAGVALTSAFGAILNGDTGVTIRSGKEVYISSEEDMSFRFKDDRGYYRTIRMQEIWDTILKVFPD